jgi:hypothetical protein
MRNQQGIYGIDPNVFREMDQNMKRNLYLTKNNLQ